MSTWSGDGAQRGPRDALSTNHWSERFPRFGCDAAKLMIFGTSDCAASKSEETRSKRWQYSRYPAVIHSLVTLERHQRLNLAVEPFN
jgi:hypothetical protein